MLTPEVRRDKPLFIAIVNYRTGALTADCLESLATMRGDLCGGRVIVVDNASGDDSIDIIRGAIERRAWNDWVELMPMGRNGGFAYGNNAAIQRVRELCPEFGAVLMLNPDTIARAGVLKQLAGFLEAHPAAGIVGALIENDQGQQQVSAHSAPSAWSELEGSARLGVLSRLMSEKAGRSDLKGAPQSCDWVSGACMAVRREVIDSIGPMDEGYFLYFEEVDFCLRARKAGWSCWFVPAARVMHIEGASTGILAGRRRRAGYWYASRRRYFVKANGLSGLMAADFMWALGRFSLVVRRLLGLGGRKGQQDEPTWLAFDLLIGDLKAFVNGELLRIRRIANH